MPSQAAPNPFDPAPLETTTADFTADSTVDPTADPTSLAVQAAESLYGCLRDWRWRTARELDLPVFYVLTNAQLAALSWKRPLDMDQLAACPGMGPKKLARFGTALLSLIASAVSVGLAPGVEPPPTAAPGPLTDDDLSEIAAGLRLELAQRLARRFRGRFTSDQLEEALRRLNVPA